MKATRKELQIENPNSFSVNRNYAKGECILIRKLPKEEQLTRKIASLRISEQDLERTLQLYDETRIAAMSENLSPISTLIALRFCIKIHERHASQTIGKKHIKTIDEIATILYEDAIQDESP